MTKDEALKLAYDETWSAESEYPIPSFDDVVSFAKKLQAVKEALAQPEQEPVAWMCADESLINKGYARFSHVCMGDWKIPVYTTPPQRPLRSDIKPLTDEEIEDIWADCPADWDDKINVLTLARAIEAAHGIKGEA